MTTRRHESMADPAGGGDPGVSGSRPDPWWTAYEATRSMLHAVTIADISDAVRLFVRNSGGRIVRGDDAPPGSLPIDVSLGHPEPLLVAADTPAVRRHLARFLPRVVEDARLAAGRIQHEERLTTDATVDPLTGLLNRRGLARIVPRLTDADTIVAFDLDGLKEINDTYGHAAGDLLISRFAQMLIDHARLDDRCGRTGGDEFVVALRDAGVDGARALCDRMLAAWPALAPYPSTFSAGIANVDEGPPAKALIRADRALYRAKRQGGGAIEIILSVDDAGIQ